MNIVISESTVVKPAEETPKIDLWISHMDLLVPKFHTQILYFYRPTGNFFDAKVMKEALSKVLVPFYPIGGRLKKDQDGRIEIDCRGQGVLFVEAESDGLLDDFTDFTPSIELQKLCPTVDYSLGIDSYPLLLVQVTYFKCGGVCLGVAFDHHVVDGLSMVHFINSWSELARGLVLTLQPFIDRTQLRARDPPQPIFEHIEFQPIPSIKSVVNIEPPVTSHFRLTLDQLNVLAAKSKGAFNFSTYQMLAAHIWRSVCKARGLQDDVVTGLYIPAEVRAHLQPSLPPGYFGNAICMVTVKDVAGKVQSNPILYAMNRIHEEIALQRKNDYIKSGIDYLELLPHPEAILRGYEGSRPTLGINSWAKLKFYEADFGCGSPLVIVPANFTPDGVCLILPIRINDGSMSIAMTLQAQHMKLFSKFLYDI